jgi:hypothetical protein
VNINEKWYRKKSPEAVALESTVAHFLLFSDKNLNYVTEKSKCQSKIDLELELIAKDIGDRPKVRAYVY